VLAPTPRSTIFGWIPKLSRFIQIIQKKAQFRGFEIRKSESEALLELSVTINCDAVAGTKVQTIDTNAILCGPIESLAIIDFERKVV
jgi:hypothetical protein